MIYEPFSWSIFQDGALTVTKSMEVGDLDTINSICYSTSLNMVFLAKFNFSADSILYGYKWNGEADGPQEAEWRLPAEDGGDVEGTTKLQFVSLSADDKGRVYVSEMRKENILVVDGSSGQLIQVKYCTFKF